MRFLRNRLARRFPRLGLLSDLALVGAAASRLARRGDTTTTAGASPGSNIEMALAAGAAVRLVKRLARRRGARRAARRGADLAG